MHQCCRTVTTNHVFLRTKGLLKNLVNLNNEEHCLDSVNIEVEEFHLHSAPLSL